MNPIMQLLNQQQTQNGIFDLINLVRNSLNPQGVISSLAQNNPQVQQVMQYVNQNGGDPKAAFYKKAQEMGVDPNLIINQLK